MKKFTFTIGFLLSFAFVLAPMAGPSSKELKNWKISSSSSTKTVDHGSWDKILKKYISNKNGVNLFAYGKVSSADKKSLKSYIDQLKNTDPRELNRKESMAYWINAYNAITVDVVLDNYPVKSIKDIKSGIFTSGPWKTDIFKIQGQHLSLDNIEHGILRAVYKDPRVHYAVNCASYSCPNLAKKAFTGSNLESLLNQGARDYINHPRGVSVESDGDLKISSIFNWFKEDFGTKETKVIEHLKKYAQPSLKAKLDSFNGSVSYDYGWDLNE